MILQLMIFQILHHSLHILPAQVWLGGGGGGGQGIESESESGSFFLFGAGLSVV